ncbi:hypothetical protein [Boseongicola sp. H5]|uniref:hypothetical protein n=1 Tax=Boseongicola sp. H5 TaxID=2763261 RepID=UPI001D0B012F|nr:hypothetical protein [Boseongicola sp. H5]
MLLFSRVSIAVAYVLVAVGLYLIATGFMMVADQEIQGFRGMPFVETPQFMKDAYRLCFAGLVLGVLAEISLTLRARSKDT